MKSKLLIVASVAIAATLGASSAMAGGYGYHYGGNKQFAYAGAKNIAKQKAYGFLAVNVTGAVANAKNINRGCGCSRSLQDATAIAESTSYQHAHGLIAINASGAFANAVNVNGGGRRSR